MTIPTCPKCNSKSSKESIRDIARGDGDYGYFHRCLDWNILPEKYQKLKHPLKELLVKHKKE